VYRSVRDPAQGGCIAVLTPKAFSKNEPVAAETWNLSVTLDRVIWQKSDVLSPEAFEFPAGFWALTEWIGLLTPAETDISLY
jgi:hypothetical protein